MLSRSVIISYFFVRKLIAFRQVWLFNNLQVPLFNTLKLASNRKKQNKKQKFGMKAITVRRSISQRLNKNCTPIFQFAKGKVRV